MTVSAPHLHVLSLEEKWQKIDEYEASLRLARSQLTLLRRPGKTMRLFMGALSDASQSAFVYLSMHPFMIYFLLPTVVTWVLLEMVPGFYTDTVNRIEVVVQFCVWWCGLGILSSIGLGTGMQSGLLFLYPHIFKVVLAAQECRSLEFDSMSNMWLREPATLFQCPPDVPLDAEVGFFGMYVKVFWASFIWGSGTAIGEIPPYWISRAASLAEESADMPEELQSSSRYDIINRMKQWMIRFLKQHGFLGVFMMAAWPNIAFDLCGICCGHFQMPFYTFFFATFLGKAVVKTTYQTMFLVALFSKDYIEVLIVALQALSPDSFHLDQFIRDALEEGRTKLHPELDNQRKSYTNPLIVGWKVLMLVLMCMFLLSCVQQFAQFRASYLDRKCIEQLKRDAEAGAQSTDFEILCPACPSPPLSSRAPRLATSIGTGTGPTIKGTRPDIRFEECAGNDLSPLNCNKKQD